MIGLTGVNALSTLPPVTATVSTDPRQMRIEFDALILESLLKFSGILSAIGGSGKESASLLGDMMAYPLARQLAEQTDLGFGAMMTRSSGAVAAEEMKHD